MGRALTSRRISFRGLRVEGTFAAPALPGWTPLTSVASFPPGSQVAEPLTACRGVFRQSVRIQEFVNLIETGVLPWIPCLWIPVEPTGKLAPEGVELEFRWVIPRVAQEEMLGKTRKVMFQCQKRTLFFLTLDGAKPLPLSVLSPNLLLPNPDLPH